MLFHDPTLGHPSCKQTMMPRLDQNRDNTKGINKKYQLFQATFKAPFGIETS